MNLTVYDMQGGETVVEYHNPDAWFAEIKLENGRKLQMRIRNGELELSSPDGKLVLEPQASNSLGVTVGRF